MTNRKVVVQEFVTLDGLGAGPHGRVDFIAPSTQGDQAFGRDQLAFIDTVGTIVLGRATYEMLARYWPHVIAGAEKPFADKLNAMPKVVLSRTLDRAPWGTWDEARIVTATPADEVARLKRQTGKAIAIWGSITLVQSLIPHGLVDEYRLVICPVVLGGGRRLFNDGIMPISMTLAQINALDRGAVALTYVVHPRFNTSAATRA